MELGTILMIAWAVLVIAAAVSQWYIIEKLKRYPNKKLWFAIRVIVGGLFLWLFIRDGYLWYWAASYLVFVFWFPFNVILNLLRGKGALYLSPINSTLDRIALWIFRVDMAVYGFGLIMMISSIAIMVLYGQCTYAEINNGYCR